MLTSAQSINHWFIKTVDKPQPFTLSCTYQPQCPCYCRR